MTPDDDNGHKSRSDRGDTGERLVAHYYNNLGHLTAKSTSKSTAWDLIVTQQGGALPWRLVQVKTTYVGIGPDTPKLYLRKQNGGSDWYTPQEVHVFIVAELEETPTGVCITRMWKFSYEEARTLANGAASFTLNERAAAYRVV